MAPNPTAALGFFGDLKKGEPMGLWHILWFE